MGFQNFYLYGAVKPSGEDFTMISSNVNTECFNIYLDEFSKYLGERKVVMVIDGAGWHKSKDLKVPNNIMLIYLPPYSPELNPVERLWRYIKDHTSKNDVFLDLEQVESVSKIINSLNYSTVASICNLNQCKLI